MVGLDPTVAKILSNVDVISSLSVGDKLAAVDGSLMARKATWLQWTADQFYKNYFADFQSTFENLLKDSELILVNRANINVLDAEKNKDTLILIRDAWTKSIEQNKGLNNLLQSYPKDIAKRDAINKNIADVQSLVDRTNALITKHMLVNQNGKEEVDLDQNKSLHDREIVQIEFSPQAMELNPPEPIFVATLEKVKEELPQENQNLNIMKRPALLGLTVENFAKQQKLNEAIKVHLENRDRLEAPVNMEHDQEVIVNEEEEIEESLSSEDEVEEADSDIELEDLRDSDNDDEPNGLGDGFNLEAFCSTNEEKVYINKGFGEFNFGKEISEGNLQCQCGLEMLQNINSFALKNCRYTFNGIDQDWQKINSIPLNVEEKHLFKNLSDWKFFKIKVEQL